MQQVLQPIDGRATEVAEIPAPVCGPDQILIANRYSLISAGTERSTVELARQSLLQKARSRPDHVKRVLQKVRQEGLVTTIQQVRAKLDQPIPLGYSSAGIVLEVGENVRDFRVGQAAASNGCHAGVVAISRNLAAQVPDSVPLDQAAYAVVGAIGLQGVRLANVGIGDVVAVIGLGLIGQITVALLKSAGCTVIGTDLDSSKRALALEMGADDIASGGDFLATVQSRTNGRGVDAVLITASTSSNGPIELAAKAARQKGKIVAVGAVGMNIPRREFYPKELDFVVSCSYGPGRYDPAYEDAGRDYPYSYVRWTEQRNISAVLQLMAQGRLPVDRLTTHRFAIASANDAYQMIENGTNPYLGILLEYPETETVTRKVALARQLDSASRSGNTAAANAKQTGSEPIGLSFVGAGNFAGSTLLPAFVRAGSFRCEGLVSAGGLSAHNLGSKHGFRFSATDYEEVLADERTSAVVIATRHNLHASMTLAAIRAGKHVFLEKPLAITEDQLEELSDGLDHLGDASTILTVGFNRRFSPGARILRETFQSIADPKMVNIRFNAGAIPADHWTQDPKIGGGRIIGEACHAVDLATYLIGSLPVRVYAERAFTYGKLPEHDDNVTLTIRHEDGSVSNILYTSGGDRASGKERVEMFGGETTAVLDDFRSVEVFRGGKRTIAKKWWSQKKGYAEEIAAFAQSVRAGQPSIPVRELFAVTSTCLRAVQSLRMELPLDVA